MGKRYYWLKLKDDFFDSKRIKKLRKLAGGDTYTIIYLKMQLLSVKTDGILRFTSLEPTFAEELALDIDESVDDVRMCLTYLQNTGLIETSDNINFLLPYAVENTGSEGASAQRVRDYRERMLQSNAQALQSNSSVTPMKQICNGEKEIEKRDRDREKSKSKTDAESEALSALGEPMRLVVQDWLNYKKEKRQAYKPTGLKSLISTINNKVAQYGEKAVSEVIHYSMNCNYQGIVWAKLDDKPKQTGQPVKVLTTSDIELDETQRLIAMTQRLRGG